MERQRSLEQIQESIAEMAAELDGHLAAAGAIWKDLKALSAAANDAAFREALKAHGLPGGYKPSGRPPLSLRSVFQARVLPEGKMLALRESAFVGSDETEELQTLEQL